MGNSGDNHTHGKNGEDIALRYLISHGYTLLAQNYRFLKAEIDIIVKKDNTIVFVEVKLRNSLNQGHPLECISHEKRKHLFRGIQGYCREYHISLDDCRLDAIGLLKKKDGTGYRLWHIKGIEI